MPKLKPRQFTLRALIGFTGFVCLTCAIAARSDPHTLKGIIQIGIAVRILAIAVVSVTIGFVVDSIAKVFVATTIGVLLADLVWSGLLFSLSAIGRNDAEDVVTNPIVLMVLIACPAAGAKNRACALTVGIALSIVVPPIAAATVGISYYRPGPGSSMFVFVLGVVALLAIGIGILGTLAARLVVEVSTHFLMRKTGADPQD